MPGGETAGPSRVVTITTEETIPHPVVTISTQNMNRIDTEMIGGTAPGMVVPGTTGERPGVVTIAAREAGPGMDLARP